MSRTMNLYGTKPETEYDTEKVAPYNELADLFDNALGGETSITTTGSTTTLSTAQATKARIKVSGTLTSDATIEIPISATTGRLRSFMIHNNTSGSYKVKVKLVGGSALVVPQGQTVIVSHNGTDTVVVQTAANGWTAPTLLNSWVNFGGSPAADNAGYRLRNGRVELNGCIKTGTIGTVAFTLPVPYRPSARKHIACDSNNAYGKVQVDANGDVTPFAGASSHFSLDNVSFDPA